LSTVSIFPFAPGFYFFDLHPGPLPPVPFCLYGPNSQSFICFLWIPSQLQIIYHFSDWPVHALSCALSCFCLWSAWAPCHWFLLLGRMGVAFIERRLSLLILFIIFFASKIWMINEFLNPLWYKCLLNSVPKNEPKWLMFQCIYYQRFFQLLKTSDKIVWFSAYTL
jgi:hypothetical protein